MMFQVGKSEELTDPDTGEVLDRTSKRSGHQSRYSPCRSFPTIDGADKIQKGMPAMPHYPQLKAKVPLNKSSFPPAHGGILDFFICFSVRILSNI